MAKEQTEFQAGLGSLDQKDKPKVPPTPLAKKVNADRMLACRFEMKYLIDEIRAAGIVRYIRPFLQPDRYSKLRRDGMYPIVSLYLDSPDLRLCRETLTGQKNRFKLRIRSYTDEPEYPRFFEIKRRINQVIFKSRARVTDRDVPTLLTGRSLPPQGYSTDEDTLNQFQFYVASIHAGPMVLIRYLRQAFEGTGEARVRVTFDRELCYKVTHESQVRLGGPGWQHHTFTTGHTILEIKFTGRYPAWLTRLVRDFELEVTPVSKYATSITQACRLGFCGPALRVPWNG
ncbi:MAG: polyphosphate polymerase domain-containing protein [Phycisphaerae bacterium]|nr:polyphosphate polymerase domain-containing protein [Phycisphaerae bacterium]